MIDKNELIKISKLFSLKPWQQEKHYVQTLTLLSLAEQQLVFKGGTYLWFAHNLKRFSEDLDFTETGSLREDLQEKVSEDLTFFGLENSVKTINEDDLTLSFRISAKGPLNTSDTDLCYIYVEISRREKVIEKTLPIKIDFPAYHLPTKIIAGMSLSEVAAEKARAIITRNRARDVFDLHFLSNKIKFNKNLVNEKLSFYDLEFSNDLFFEKLREKKILWKKDLQSLLFEGLPDFDKVEDELTKWIKIL
ncbi:nucleotidyl transferase AbiEii/AbiGii toxin family protein [Candidatus Micrarchaeota archaeon]|nr:nucleotidyl transferase AbiEii/AbiGii toxin family protein [Candidatus Micrarchaeota archaeon]